LKRVFAIEIERCLSCGRKLRVIASIEDQVIIERSSRPPVASSQASTDLPQSRSPDRYRRHQAVHNAYPSLGGRSSTGAPPEMLEESHPVQHALSAVIPRRQPVTGRSGARTCAGQVIS
jgi:hypothetical protein